MAQLLLKESERIINEIEIKIEKEIGNDHITTGSTKRKQLEEKHLKFIQQLENRRVKKWKKFKERSRKEKYDGAVQERGNRGVNEIKQLLDGRSDPLESEKRLKVILYN